MTCHLLADTAAPEGAVTLDLFLQNAANVRGYQATIAITRRSGAGEVTVGCPDGVTVDLSRPDYIFAGIDTANLQPDCAKCGVVAPHCEGKRVAAARVTGGVDVGITAKYLASFTLNVSADATPGSTFEIAILSFPDSIVGASDNSAIPFTPGPNCVLTIIEPPLPKIPTVSEWGVVVLTLLLLIGAKLYFGRSPARGTGRTSVAPVLIFIFSLLPCTASAQQVCQENADCDDGDVCSLDRCGPDGCVHTPRRHGDLRGPAGCGPDGIVDELDIIEIRVGFRGTSGSGCSDSDRDILGPQDGCEPDGTVDLFDIFAVLSAFAGESKCPCPEPCSIKITRIDGAYVNTIGTFGLENDPHNPSRLFIDTVTGGAILADKDMQNVKLESKITLTGEADPAEYKVLWEVRDPDDPADHKDIDSNDGGTPTGGTAKGGDNIDKLPADGVAKFFTKADHDILKDPADPGSDPAVPNKVIGSATTKLDGALTSTVKFNYGDEGGDNYIITATCIKGLTQVDQTRQRSDETKTLTVWRKRNVDAYAMESDATDGDRVVDPADATIIIYPPGGAYRILKDKAAIQKALRDAYANTSDANKNAYLDIVVDEPANSQKTKFFETIRDTRVNPGDADDTASYVYVNANLANFHIGGANPKDLHTDNLYQVLGVKHQGDSGQFAGDTLIEPHSYVPVHTIRKDTVRDLRGAKKERFAIKKNDTITITVENEDGTGSGSQEIKFDRAPFDDTATPATAAAVVNEIINDRGALPITATVLDVVEMNGGVATGVTEKRVHIGLNVVVANIDNTIKVDDGVGGVCAILGIDCGVVQNDSWMEGKVLIHEMGHNLLVKTAGVLGAIDNFDKKIVVHTGSVPCAFYQGVVGTSKDICPMHVRNLRDNVSRSWAKHINTAQTVPDPIGNDSD